jgi:AcrR family transcriptional regulator
MEKKEKILQEAQTLFLKYGVRSVSMDDISSRLGISKKTLYHFIDNKRDLIKEVVSQHIMKEEEELSTICQVSTDAIEEMMNIAKHVIELLRNMQPTLMYDLKKYYKESWHLLESLHMQFVGKCIKSNIERGIKEGLYRREINPDIIARIYVGKSLLVTDEELFPSQKYEKKDLFTEFIFYHMNGIASEKGLARLKQLNEN